MTKGERTSKGLRDLRTIASVSIMRGHLTLAITTLEVALALRAFAYELEGTGYDSDPFVVDHDPPPELLQTKGQTIQSLADDLKRMAQDLIDLEHERTAQLAVRCAVSLLSLLQDVKADGVADNLLVLAQLKAEGETAPTAGQG